MVGTVKKHAPFIAMTIAAFLLLFAAISRGSEPVWMDAAPDAIPDAVVSDPLPVAKEVIVSSVSHVTPSQAQPECADGLCRVVARSQADESAMSATRDATTRPFRSRQGILRRIFRR